MRERDIESYLIEQVKKRGGEIRKVQWIARSSAPDRRVMHPRLGCWVELKAPGKRATPAQAREHARMREMGEVVYVFNSIEQIDEWLMLHAAEPPRPVQIHHKVPCVLMRKK